MASARDQETPTWSSPLRSPLRWVALIHAILLITVDVFWCIYPTSEILHTLGGSLVIAQLTLIGTCIGLNAPQGQWPLPNEMIVPMLVLSLGTPLLMVIVMAHAFVARSPIWICIPVFANFLLTSARFKGWQLRRFAADEVPLQPFQFSIRGMLVAMLILAVLFGLNAITNWLRGLPDEYGLFHLLPEVTITFVMYGSVPVIAAWALLSPGRLLPRVGIALLGLTLLALVLLQGPADRAAVKLIPWPMLMGSLAIFTANLFILRLLRYRIIRGERMRLFP